jgi:hypothetical protein
MLYLVIDIRYYIENTKNSKKSVGGYIKRNGVMKRKLQLKKNPFILSQITYRKNLRLSRYFLVFSKYTRFIKLSYWPRLPMQTL